MGVNPLPVIEKVNEDHLRVNGKVRVLLEETPEGYVTSGEGGTIDLWLKPQREDTG